MTHAVPITYCLNCDNQYDHLQKSYNELITKTDEKNVSCQSQLFNVDRLNLIQSSYTAGNGLWTGGYCDNCYESPLVVSNSTQEFLELLDEHKKCTDDTSRSTGDVCKECLGSYERVNGDYEAIRKKANDAVCFDLQDKINETRRYWSIEVNCNKNPDEKQITFLILTALVTSLPICFYVFMFVRQHQAESSEENINFLNESSAELEEDQDEVGPSVSGVVR